MARQMVEISEEAFQQGFPTSGDGQTRAFVPRSRNLGFGMPSLDDGDSFSPQQLLQAAKWCRAAATN